MNNNFYFLNKLIQTDRNLKFQYWFKGLPSKTWFNYKEMLGRHPKIFQVNNEILRTGINTDEIQEFKIDLDTKDDKKEKNLNSCIETYLKIKEVLDHNEIIYSAYYSGGLGIHIQFLYDNEPFKEYEDLKKVREFIAKYLNIYNLLDEKQLSNNSVLTMESYCKRKTKTNERKIVLDNKLKSIHEIKTYIEKNKFRDDLVDKDFFNHIHKFSNEIIKYVEESITKFNSHKKEEEKSQSEPIVEEKKFSPSNMSQQKQYSATPETIMKFLYTFSQLYKEKCQESDNKIYLMVITYLYKTTRNKEDTLKYFNMFFDVFKTPENYKEKTREVKVNRVIEYLDEKNHNWFIDNPYFNKKQFWDKYKQIFPGSVGK